MLLQTNSYIVPKEKRSEHARLMRRFRQVLGKLGCDLFEAYEQVGANWNGADASGRFVQIMRFRDRKHQMSVQNAEKNDPVAQALIAEFCALVNFQYQQQQGYFAVGFYNGVLPGGVSRAEAAAMDAESDHEESESGDSEIPLEETSAVAVAGYADDEAFPEGGDQSAHEVVSFQSTATLESGDDAITDGQSPAMIEGEVTEVVSDSLVTTLDAEHPDPSKPGETLEHPEIASTDAIDESEHLPHPLPAHDIREGGVDGESHGSGDPLSNPEGFTDEFDGFETVDEAPASPHAGQGREAIPLSEDELLGELTEATPGFGDPGATVGVEPEFDLEMVPHEVPESTEAAEMHTDSDSGYVAEGEPGPESELPVAPSDEIQQRPSLFQRFRRK